MVVVNLLLNHHGRRSCQNATDANGKNLPKIEQRNAQLWPDRKRTVERGTIDPTPRRPFDTPKEERRALFPRIVLSRLGIGQALRDPASWGGRAS